MWTPACIAAISMIAFAQRAPVQLPYTPTQPAAHPLDGRYKIYWDDKIDGKTDQTLKKTCDIQISVVGKDIVGRFIGPIAGENREAFVVGQVDSSTPPLNLLTFRQIERGYTCSYQLTLGAGSFTGVWHDTKGRSGDFLMLKWQ